MLRNYFKTEICGLEAKYAAIILTFSRGKKKSRAEEDESDQYDDDIDAFHKQKEKVLSILRIY